MVKRIGPVVEYKTVEPHSAQSQQLFVSSTSDVGIVGGDA